MSKLIKTRTPLIHASLLYALLPVTVPPCEHTPQSKSLTSCYFLSYFVSNYLLNVYYQRAVSISGMVDTLMEMVFVLRSCHKDCIFLYVDRSVKKLFNERHTLNRNSNHLFEFTSLCLGF